MDAETNELILDSNAIQFHHLWMVVEQHLQSVIMFYKINFFLYIHKMVFTQLLENIQKYFTVEKDENIKIGTVNQLTQGLTLQNKQ